jgi:hypothetical protein
MQTIFYFSLVVALNKKIAHMFHCWFLSATIPYLQCTGTVVGIVLTSDVDPGPQDPYLWGLLDPDPDPLRHY